MSFKKKIIAWLIWIIFPLSALITIVLLIYKPPITLYPGNLVSPYSFSDAESGQEIGSKISRFDTTNHQILISYKLHDYKNADLYPYAGIGLLLSDTLDISGYNELHATLNSGIAKSILLNIETRFYNPIEQNNIARLVRTELPGNKENQYTFDLNTLLSPPWWYQEKGLSIGEAGPISLQKVTELQISTGNNFTANEENTLLLKSIIIKKNNTIAYLFLFGGIVLYYIFIFLLNRKKTIISPLFVPYQEVTLPTNKESDRLIKYLNENYSNIQLSASTIQKETGIPAYRISDILKTSLDLNFKQYLNSIRIAEAKRLLETTDNQVTEIAVSVGYNTITHFNKVFKDETGFSPKEYRIMHKNA